MHLKICYNDPYIKLICESKIMNELIKWLIHNLHNSQSKVTNFSNNWVWYLLGLVLMIIVV